MVLRSARPPGRRRRSFTTSGCASFRSTSATKKANSTPKSSTKSGTIPSTAWRSSCRSSGIRTNGSPRPFTMSTSAKTAGATPRAFPGGQISEYGKVIGLADVYEALTHHRPHRKRMLPHKAVQEIVQTQKVQFHQRLLKVMIEELSVFSLNSLVRLNLNAIGARGRNDSRPASSTGRPADIRRGRQRNNGRPLHFPERISSSVHCG